VGSSQGTQSGIDLIAFQSMDMTDKVVLSVSIPFGRQNEYFKTFKVALRHENSHAIVNAAVKIYFSHFFEKFSFESC
jgi:xanthine dehydrogenase iron-sulfur cluster and FAD-binding subunit A